MPPSSLAWFDFLAGGWGRKQSDADSYLSLPEKKHPEPSPPYHAPPGSGLA